MRLLTGGAPDRTPLRAPWIACCCLFFAAGSYLVLCSDWCSLVRLLVAFIFYSRLFSSSCCCSKLRPRLENRFPKNAICMGTNQTKNCAHAFFIPNRSSVKPRARAQRSRYKPRPSGTHNSRYNDPGAPRTELASGICACSPPPGDGERISANPPPA